MFILNEWFMNVLFIIIGIITIIHSINIITGNVKLVHGYGYGFNDYDFNDYGFNHYDYLYYPFSIMRRRYLF